MKTGDSSNLNLLPSQAKFQAARMKLQGILRQYMSLALVIWVAVIIVVVVLYLGSNFILNLQNKKYQQSLSSLKGMSEEVVTNQLMKFRTKVLGQVLKDRFEYSVAFEKINSIFTEKAKVAKFELNKNKEFIIEVRAPDKEALNYVEDKVAEANKGLVDGVKTITIDSANYTLGNNWSINMEVALK